MGVDWIKSHACMKFSMDFVKHKTAVSAYTTEAVLQHASRRCPNFSPALIGLSPSFSMSQMGMAHLLHRILVTSENAHLADLAHYLANQWKTMHGYR